MPSTKPTIDAEAKRKRQSERTCAVNKHKKDLRQQGQTKCEICGWSAPDYLQNMSGRSNFTVNLHHVLPTASGGAEEPENLILLCPNHHAIADLLSGRFNKGRGSKINSFITDKAELIEMLHLIDSDPIKWEAQMEERDIETQRKMVNILSELCRDDN